MSKKLRPYQQASIDSINTNLSKGIDKALLVLATGLGKTVTAVKTAEQFKKTLFIVDSEELLEQAALAFLRDKFDSEFSNNVAEMGFINYIKNPHYFAAKGFKMGAIKQDLFEIGDVTIASIQTLYRRLHLLDPEEFDCVIVDEAHCYMAKTYQKGVLHFNPKLRLGLTATPQRADNLPLGDLFDKIIYEYNIADGIKDGYLVELDAIKVTTNVSLDSVRTTAGDLNNADLSNEINTLARNNLVVDKWIQYCKGRKTIVFACNIQHALDLCEAFLNKGISATAVSSDEELTGDRSKKVKDFKKGVYDVIINVNILTKGFDEPGIQCIVAAAPTKSLTRYMQAIGRGTRILPGVIDMIETIEGRWSAIKSSDKKDCIILDIVDNTNRHNIVNAWNLDRELPPEERVFTTQEKRDKLISARSAKLEHKQEKDERSKLLKIPRFKINYGSENMKKLATQPQLEWIKRLGHDVENNVFTNAMCQEIIGQQPLPHAKKEELRKMGYDVDSKPLTNSDYAAVMKEMWIKNKKNENKYKPTSGEDPF